jgi:hypothetical protein
MMEHYLFNLHDSCIDALTEGHPASKDPVSGKEYTACGTAPGGLPKSSFFVGNFWMARCSHINTLRRISLTPEFLLDRFRAETWICGAWAADGVRSQCVLRTCLPQRPNTYNFYKMVTEADYVGVETCPQPQEAVEEAERLAPGKARASQSPLKSRWKPKKRRRMGKRNSLLQKTDEVRLGPRLQAIAEAGLGRPLDKEPPELDDLLRAEALDEGTAQVAHDVSDLVEDDGEAHMGEADEGHEDGTGEWAGQGETEQEGAGERESVSDQLRREFSANSGLSSQD